MWLLRELHIVQPKIVVVMGEDTLAVVNGLDLALAKPLEPELGVVQHLTPTIEALVHAPARALARRRGRQAPLLGRLPRARRVVRGPAAVLIQTVRSKRATHSTCGVCGKRSNSRRRVSE